LSRPPAGHENSPVPISKPVSKIIQEIVSRLIVDRGAIFD